MDYIKDNKGRMLLAAVFIIAALISFFLIGGYTSDPENFTGTTKYLEDKRETVMALTGGAAAASAAITLIPGDAGTPIAEKLVDMSGYFMIILAAILLEKWLLTVTGMLAFKLIIPIALAGLAINLFVPKQAMKSLFIKLICFAIVLFIAIPASVTLSKMIDESYRASIEEAINNAEEKSKDIQDTAGNESDSNALEKIFASLKGGVSKKIEEFKDILSDFVEAAAVLIVTSCVIPLAVILFFIWVLKMILGLKIELPDIRLSDKFKNLRSNSN